MRSMNSRCIAKIAHILCAFAVLATALFAQGKSQARITAQLSTGVIKLGASATLLVTVENAAYSEVRGLPKVDGLEIGPLSAPSTRSATTYINGRVTRSDSRTWGIPVRPLAKGDYTIPPIELVVDGAPTQTSALVLTVVEDLKGEELGFFTITPSTHKVVEGQPFSVELRFGWDAGLRDRVNYANLSLPWWGQLPGTLDMDPAPAAPGVRLTEIQLNSETTIKVEEYGTTTVRGRQFRTFRMIRSFTPTRANPLEFPTSFLEFGRISEVGDFFSRRQAKEESYFARAEGFQIEVVPLPEQGRPLDFSGAIGSFKVRSVAEPRDVDAGDSIKFTVEYTGAGNLEFFEAPDPARMDSFKGFRTYGKTESKFFDRRTIVYDIAPMSPDVKEIPPLPLSVFDPEAGQYTTVQTVALPIRVRALAKGSGLEVEGEGGSKSARDLRDIHSEALATLKWTRPGPWGIGVALASAPLVWFALRSVARRRGDPDAPLERRRRKARKQLMKRLAAARSAREELDALHDFLAARTREPREAWQGRDVKGYLLTRPPPRPSEGDVAELDALVRELERETWAGSGTALPRERIETVSQRLIGGGL